MSKTDPKRRVGRPRGRVYGIQERVNLSREILDQLKALAARAGCSRSEMIRRLIAQAADQAK